VLSGFTPPLLLERSDHVRKAEERHFHALPVRVAVAMHKPLTHSLSDFPSANRQVCHLKSSN
jgi:hypothetical protein